MSNEIITSSDYALIERREELKQLLVSNLGNDQIRAFDLDRVRVPSGGGKSWMMPTLEGEKAIPEINGIVLHWKPKRAYWSQEITQGETAPECKSEDGVLGFGTPGGQCNECPYSKWGSGKNGGQRCKLMRFLFMVTPQDLLPFIVIIPPTSVDPIRKYFMRLISKGLRYYSVETKLRLVEYKNAQGIKYSRVDPIMGRMIDPDTVKSVEDFLKNTLSAFENTTMDSDDLSEQ